MGGGDGRQFLSCDATLLIQTLSFAGSLNNKMKERRKEKAVISTVGDILLERVSWFHNAQNLIEL